MAGPKTKFIRKKIATIRWFVVLAVLSYSYWWVMTNYVVRDFYDPQYVMKLESLQARLREHPGHPLWLTLGSSRVERGFRPGLLEDRMSGKDAPLIYNFGLGGASMFRQYICLRRLLEAGIKPQRVGIEVAGVSMSNQAFEIDDSPQLLIRARKDELNNYIWYSSKPAEFLSGWRQSRLNPAYKFGMKIPHQTLSWRLIPLPWVHYLEKVPYDKWGWFPVEPAPIPPAIYNANFAVAKADFGDKFGDFKISPRTDLPLRHMLEMCKEAGIDAFLVETPEAKEFHALYTPEANAVIESYLAKIEAEYGVPLIDATTWIATEGFTDGYHLNATGAEEFTRRFADELFKTAKTQPVR